MDKVDINKLIRDNCFKYIFLMNDTFYYACADACEIDSDDFNDLEPIIQKYDYDAIIAYEALKRGHDPQITKYVTPAFKEAKKEIQEVMDKAEEFGEFFNLRNDIAYRIEKRGS